MLTTEVKRYLDEQFYDATAQGELAELSPNDYDWAERTSETLDALVPRLVPLASRIKTEIPKRLNSPQFLLTTISDGSPLVIRQDDDELRDWYDTVSKLSGEASSLIANLESQQISAEIQRYIVSDKGLGDLVFANGNSIYPDLILLDRDYSLLPEQNRTNPIDGPCVRGKNRRPSNVPDGCEIKTKKGNRISVDAHGAHAGLHLGVTWDIINNLVKITGVWAAYVRVADHRESGRNVNVTTVKYSFGHKLFISLL